MCPAWARINRCKSVAGAHSANGKGVHRKMEFEGRLRQNLGLKYHESHLSHKYKLVQFVIAICQNKTIWNFI